jgi:saccharopine dehydrogenase-like NADP-dependent oxidoreductase
LIIDLKHEKTIINPNCDLIQLLVSSITRRRFREGLSEQYYIIILKLLRIFSRLDKVAKNFGDLDGIGIDFISDIIKNFANSKNINVDGTAIVANISACQENRKRIQDNGFLKIILTSMNKWKAEGTVQAELCAAISNLAAHDENGKYIADQHGCNHSKSH